jgi:hypothetical protein
MPLSDVEYRRPSEYISTFHTIWSVGTDHLGSASGSPAPAAWPLSNRAILVPIYAPVGGRITQLWSQNGTAAGNISMGLYDENYVRLIVSSVVPQVAQDQYFGITGGSYYIYPGRYYLGLLLSSNSAQVFRSAMGAQICRIVGIVQQDGLGTLPNTFSPSPPSSSYFPLCGFTIVKD